MKPDPEQLEHQKKSMRSLMKRGLQSVTAEELIQKSEALSVHLKEQTEWKGAEHISVFSPIAGEPDFVEFLETEMNEGKRLLFPKTDMAHMELTFYQVSDFKEMVEVPPFGIREPDPTLHESVDPEDIDLVLVPGLAFDSNRRRLGRGKGFYDRFLMSTDAFALGVFYSFQEVQHVPAAHWDVCMNAILTDKGRV